MMKKLTAVCLAVFLTLALGVWGNGWPVYAESEEGSLAGVWKLSSMKNGDDVAGSEEIEQLEQMGYQVTTKTLECRVMESDRNIAKHLMVEEGTPIFMIKRVRSIDEGPVSLHLSYIPLRYSHGLTPELMETEQLCVVLNQNYGLQRKRVTETLESVAADKEEAELLQVKRGHPLLMLKDDLFSEGDIPYEYTKVIFRGDKFKIRLNFEQ